MSDFINKKQAGDKGEALVYGLLYAKHKEKLQHVSQYGQDGVYRDYKNRPLPDFKLPKKFVEVKTKKGFKGMINIDVKQVNDYLEVAKDHGIGINVYFVDTSEGAVYRMNEKTLHKPVKTITPSNGKPFFLFAKDKQKLIVKTMPKHFISNDLA
jgi:hypothetical protein